MRERHFAARSLRVAGLVAGVCLIVAVIGLAGPPVEDPPAATTPPQQAQPAKSDPPAKTDKDPDQALIDQWRKHIDKWKEIDPREAADNSFCYVCHANYEGEKLVKTHEAEGVGCETCHGRSDKHSQDEDSLVPPDVIFAPAKVAKFCTQCHAKRDLLEGDEAHEKFFAGQVEAGQTCTNCHDMKHKLKVRTRRWDKETRKIEWYDGVRMMQGQEKKPADSKATGQPAKKLPEN
jgi:hypothetical protein